MRLDEFCIVDNVPAFHKEILGGICIEVTAGTHGKRGGGSHSGTRTIFELKTDTGHMEATAENTGGSCHVKVELEDDWELLTFIEALEYAAEALRFLSERNVGA